MPARARAKPGSKQAAAPPRRAVRAQVELTPEQLAIRAQKGSPEAFGQLVTHFEGRVFNFLLRRVSAAEAEDLTQEAFIRAWQRIHQYDPRWRFSTWLFTIATRLATSRSRRGRPLLGLEETSGAGVSLDAGRRLVHAERRGYIWSLVDRALTQEQRTAVWLRYVEDMAMQDIAEVMGKSQVGVRVMLHRARHTLARHMEGDEAAVSVGIDVRVIRQESHAGEPT